MISRRQLGLGLLVGLGLLAPVMVLIRGNTAEAEFGASHALGTNRIDTATLDIEVGQSIAEVSARPLAPGDRRQLQVELRNAGSLPLVFNMRVLPHDSLLNGVLTWEQWEGLCDERPSELDKLVPADQWSGDEEISLIPLAVGEQKIACFAAILPIDAPNELQAAVVTYDVIVDAVHDIEDRASAGASASSEPDTEPGTGSGAGSGTGPGAP